MSKDNLSETIFKMVELADIVLKTIDNSIVRGKSPSDYDAVSAWPNRIVKLISHLGEVMIST